MKKQEIEEMSKEIRRLRKQGYIKNQIIDSLINVIKSHKIELKEETIWRI